MTRLRFTLLVGILLAALIASMTFAVMVGSVGITPSIIWEVLFSKIGLSVEAAASKAQSVIIWEIRLPRVILAAIVGASLAISGAAIQALVRNPIADPYILGVSSGASVGATMVILLGAFSFLGSYALSFAAFLGAIFAVVIVFLLARVNGRTSVIRLLLAGIAISMVFSAMTNFMLMTSKQQGGIQAVMHWMLGSLAGAKWTTIGIPFFIFLLVFILLLLNYRQLNGLLLGEELATTLGINLDRFRIFIILVVSLLTGVVVASSGSIGFVGLIIPHLVRMIVGSNYKLLLPVSALMGAVFLVWADMIARIAIAPEEMPIGIITAVCGGPFFIWMLRRRRYSFGDGE
ncbi:MULTISPECIES: iron ABC transporter permease [unclassified Sporosarcina]|uniref:FecCD family ABC transporter permease n=1 Tax=unclassified Sporosarcina TaxID=2647733 RepID=UPI0020415C06|nr:MULTISPECIES: iron chelate uptake ABC transporter family permease subunit [unclassified Sporosarcina]GKV65374.1 ABC transporter permease [Sporosarcina sp. NCCP-2331]GLB55498.1 ABC transporter permease [Sporosarcina sp. NCCP-2378]